MLKIGDPIIEKHPKPDTTYCEITHGRVRATHILKRHGKSISNALNFNIDTLATSIANADPSVQKAILDKIKEVKVANKAAKEFAEAEAIRIAKAEAEVTRIEAERIAAEKAEAEEQKRQDLITSLEALGIKELILLTPRQHEETQELIPTIVLEEATNQELLESTEQTITRFNEDQKSNEDNTEE